MGNATADFEAVLRGPDAYRVARKAMDAMVQHKVWPTPDNYEVWLRWAGAPKSVLAQEIDKLVSAGEAFTDGLCEDLAARYLTKGDMTGALREAGDQLSRELDTVTRAIQAAHLTNEAYGETLADAGAELQKGPPGQMQKLVAGLTDATR